MQTQEIQQDSLPAVYQVNPKDIKTVDTKTEKITLMPSVTNLFKDVAKGPFKQEIQNKLQQQIQDDDVEIRADGIVYLPEIKYRRILNEAFGAGAWCIVEVESLVDKPASKVFYDGILVAHGRYLARSIGEANYIARNQLSSWATAKEGAKSNCLMRCCKDLGIASELWDPRFLRKWKKEKAVKVMCDKQVKNQPKKCEVLWRRIDDEPFGYPHTEIRVLSQNEKQRDKPKKGNDIKQNPENKNTEPANGKSNPRQVIMDILKNKEKDAKAAIAKFRELTGLKTYSDIPYKKDKAKEIYYKVIEYYKIEPAKKQSEGTKEQSNTQPDNKQQITDKSNGNGKVSSRQAIMNLLNDKAGKKDALKYFREITQLKNYSDIPNDREQAIKIYKAIVNFFETGELAAQSNKSVLNQSTKNHKNVL